MIHTITVENAGFERQQEFGKNFWNRTLQAARVAGEDGRITNVFSATFFSQYNISIPDQQYRSLRLCHALCASGIVDRNKKVAIVGAGVSGMTCAVALAVKTDCIVHVFERDIVLLRRFHTAAFRYLHPNLNWWAQTSPILRDDPHARTLFPVMNWRGRYAPLVAEDLTRQFDHYRHCLGIALLRDKNVLDVFQESGKSIVLLDDGSVVPRYIDLKFPKLETFVPRIRRERASDGIEYDAVIVATGFGREKRACDVSSFERPITTDDSYWRSGDPDSYRAVARVGRPPSVLISGNGESAIIELAHYLIRDFAHHKIFTYLPLSDRSPTAWGRLAEVVDGLLYRCIELGDPDRYDLAGPISWYWSQRNSDGPSRIKHQSGRDIYRIIDKALGHKKIGEALSGDDILKLESAVDKLLDTLASDEIRTRMELAFPKSYFRRDLEKIFRREFKLIVAGPTPTIYSRRQAPMTWFLLRLMEVFAGKSLTYKKRRLKDGKIRNGKMFAKFESGADRRFDVIVARQGPTYDHGLIRPIIPAETAVSRYAVAGNPIPGDELRFGDGGPAIIENDNLSNGGYLYFLHRYFQTRLWKQVVTRGISLRDHQDSDDADLSAWLAHKSASDQDRKKAESLFRKFKAAESTKARRRIEAALRRFRGRYPKPCTEADI
jgi:hypothetical protein